MNGSRLFFCLCMVVTAWMISYIACSEDAEPESKNRIDVNCAGVEQLCWLPEINRRLAKEIVRYRSEKGPFRSKEDLLLVPGVTAALVEKLSPRLMEIPSNTCTVPDSHPGDHDWEEQPIKNIPNC
jgi:competence ComEA-like helix-hairpin-helix protein